ncbi:hypothetical protein T484DRAFT_1840463, partial [Baffinella frigidus]
MAPRVHSGRVLVVALILAAAGIFVWGGPLDGVDHQFIEELRMEGDNNTDFTLRVEAAVANNRTLFVRFFMPGSGCCQKVQPIWRKVAVRLTESEAYKEVVEFAEVNGVEERWVGDTYGAGWPTFRYYNQYTGDYGETYEVEDEDGWFGTKTPQ